MFVVSVKSSKIRIVLYVVMAAIVILMAILFFSKEYTSSVMTEEVISLRASNEKQRIGFLSQFGWDVDTEPAEVEEVVIPYEFDEVYTEYNDLQKKQGLDLEKYKGQIVKKWTYNVNNFPKYENKTGYVNANLLIFNGNIIGADITVKGKNARVLTIDFPT